MKGGRILNDGIARDDGAIIGDLSKHKFEHTGFLVGRFA